MRIRSGVCQPELPFETSEARELRLLVTADPKANESFYGYLLRLALLNGYDHPNWVLGLAGLPTLPAPKAAFLFGASTQSLKGLERLSGIESAKLAEMLYPMVAGRYFGDVRFFANPIPQYFIRVRHPTICPECLSEDSYARRIWDLSLVTTCPFHKKLLVDSCSKCRRRLTGSRRSLVECSCGYDLRLSRSTTVAEDQLVISNHVYRLCGVSHAGNLPVAPRPLIDLTLKGFSTALCFVGGQHSGITDVSGKKQATTLRSKEFHEVLMRALKVFNNWPGAFHELLEQKSQNLAPTGSGLLRQFSSFKSALYGKNVQLEFSIFRDAFESYLEERWTGGYVSVLRRKDLKSPRRLSRREASKRLGIPCTGIDGLLACGLLKGSIRNLQATRVILIEAESVEDLRERLTNSMFRKEIEKLLGLSTKVVMDLIDSGLIVPVRGPRIDGCADWHLERSGADVILKSFERGLGKLNSRGRARKWSFLHSTRYLRERGLTSADLIKDVVSGNVRPCAGDAKRGLRGFWFLADDIRALSLPNF